MLIYRKIDKVNRTTIPKWIVEHLNFKERQKVYLKFIYKGLELSDQRISDYVMYLDKNNRITIPQPYMDGTGWKYGDHLSFKITRENTIVIYNETRKVPGKTAI